MSYSIYLPPEIVKEKFLRPAGLPDDLINAISVDLWSGESNSLPRYDKHLVEKFVEERRREFIEPKSLLKEDFNMVDFGSEDQPLERIASCLEKLAGVLMPRAETPPPAAVVMLTPAEAAKQMRRHVQTVMKWCREGKLGTKCGRNWLIDPKEVDRYLRGVLLTKGHKAVAG